MAATDQIPQAVETIEFQESNLSRDNDPIRFLVKDYGIVYVTSITRDGCSGCAEQKPLFRDLAERMSQKRDGQFRFSNVHIRYGTEDPGESWRAKKVFGHAAYPTYMVHVKSHLGPLEIYRGIYPTMEELERQVASAVDLAEYYETEATKA